MNSAIAIATYIIGYILLESFGVEYNPVYGLLGWITGVLYSTAYDLDIKTKTTGEH